MSVLDQMTKGITAAAIMERKASAASGLTPVAGETTTSVAQRAATIPEVKEVFLTNEAVADIAKELRRQAATLLEVAAGLDGLTSLPSTPQVAPKKQAESVQRTAEREADEKFDADLKAKQAAAQAATFVADLDDQIKEISGLADVIDAGGWGCPKHGQGAVQTVTSRKDRVYGVCKAPGCEEFEKRA